MNQKSYPHQTNHQKLDQKIKTLVGQERELLHEIIRIVKEIDQRKTYLEMHYASLFEYLTDGVGYSAGSAQRRIEAARLLKDLPELGEKIQSGEVNLVQISLVQKASREAQRLSKVRVTSSEKSALLEQISDKNYADSQKHVAQFFDLSVLTDCKQKVQADESVRIQLSLSKELAAKIEYAQSLLSHAVPHKDLVSYLEYVTDRVIKQKTSVRPEKDKVPEDESQKSAAVAVVTTATAAAEVSTVSTVAVKMPETKPMEAKTAKPKPVRSFSARQRKIVLSRQARCQHIDPLTKKQCQSNWFLQSDHKHSVWAGGPSTLENAQTLCGPHNRLKYRKESGIKGGSRKARS